MSRIEEQLELPVATYVCRINICLPCLEYRSLVMPPFIPYKRRKSTPPPNEPPSKKASLFDAAEGLKSSKSLQERRKLLDQLNASEDESSLSEVESVEFEDALPNTSSNNAHRRREDKSDEDGEDEIAWENAMGNDTSPASIIVASAPVSGDLEITLDKATKTSYLTNDGDKKKGPTKIERQIRVATHCMHVQLLMFHNLVRSGWATDREAQSVLISQLPSNVRKEVDRWRKDSGLDLGKQEQEAKPKSQARKTQRRGRRKQSDRPQRDWGNSAARQEHGVPNMSRGNPLIRLLKVLAAYWRKRFTITAPSLRKQGYKSAAALEEELSAYKKGPYDLEDHGERVEGLEGFRKAARLCEGSRDMSVQLFTALIRGLGLEARLVASLQPIGFGWSKNEETSTAKKKKSRKSGLRESMLSISSDDDQPDNNLQLAKENGQSPTIVKIGKAKKASTNGREEERVPIDLPEDLDKESVISIDGEDDESVIDVTPTIRRRKPNANYDTDMPAPTYWTEVISPLTNQIIPVNTWAPIPASAVATQPESLMQFEPRGASADKAKQVLAYVIAFSPDGTAKDVTTRYLKRHLWPGRTKGYRIPIEKIPIYNRKGKIKHYEEYDWFKTIMSGFKRPDALRTIADDKEDETDLKPAKPEKKAVEAGKESLQWYKTSAEFVLERHLRREEAIKPGSKPVKMFTAGKGEAAKEEPVYLRKDVEACRTGESWHKEGRAVKEGEYPLKLVPVRAVTLNRKREVEEAERDGGEKLKQGLYSRNQTDWIIPPPIENGVIPKNAYGNMDCFVPTMVPKGGAHVPMRGTVKVCKRLGIDYAEAVTGFEFGNKIAVPVIEGVVVALEHQAQVIDEWAKDEEERRIKEEGKREKLALSTWRKFLMGLRVVQRFREEYIDTADDYLREEMNPFTNKNKRKGNQANNGEDGQDGRQQPTEKTISNADDAHYDEMAVEGGGFLPPGFDEEEEPPQGKSELHIENHEPKTRTRLNGTALTNLNGTAMQSNSNKDNDNKESPSPNPKTKSPTVHKKPQARGRPKSTSKAKPPGPLKTKPNHISPPSPEDSEDKSSSPSSPFPSASHSPPPKRHHPPPKPKPKPKPKSSGPSRPTPKRQAARKSQTAITSHYFDSSNDTDDDESSGESHDGEDKGKGAGRGGSVLARKSGRRSGGRRRAKD